jgi:hypothetical protein
MYVKVLIYSPMLCLLICVFRPFIIKVIIDIVLLMSTIFKLFFGIIRILAQCLTFAKQALYLLSHDPSAFYFGMPGV